MMVILRWSIDTDRVGSMVRYSGAVDYRLGGSDRSRRLSDRKPCSATSTQQQQCSIFIFIIRYAEPTNHRSDRLASRCNWCRPDQHRVTAVREMQWHHWTQIHRAMLDEVYLTCSKSELTCGNLCQSFSPTVYWLVHKYTHNSLQRYVKITTIHYCSVPPTWRVGDSDCCRQNDVTVTPCMTAPSFGAWSPCGAWDW